MKSRHLNLYLTFCLPNLLVNASDEVSKWGTGTILEVTRTSHPEDCKPLVLGCSIQESMEACLWVTPAGQNLNVQNGQVQDDTGDPVDWAEAWEGEESGNICGIRIFEMSGEQSGDWRCKISVSGDFFIEGTVTTEDEATTDLRLSNQILPLKYNLLLSPDLFDTGNDFHYFGTMTIDLEVLTTVNYIMFHSDGLSIKGMSLKYLSEEGVEEDEMVIYGIGFDYWRTFVFVHSDSPFSKGKYRLDLAYVANRKNPNYADGLYKVPCSEGQDKFCWFTQFEATGARTAFPCLDEPSLKAPFDITVWRAEGWNTLSNMPLEETVPMEDGGFSDRFATSVPISPYLIAFSISDYIGVEADGYNMTIWASKKQIDEGKAEYSRRIGVELIEFYESYFNVPYTLPKMDMVAVHGKGGAMENWGLVLYGPYTLLLDPENTDPETQWVVTKVVAHELAHQWFGNLVTTAWWSQTWLNEGFSTYMGYFAAAHVDPESHALGRFLVHETQRVMRTDADLTKTWAMSDQVKSRSDILRKFGSISYSKGGSLLRMIDAVLTSSSFVKGLTSYLEDLSFLGATEDDLFFHLESVAREDGKWPVGDFVRDSFLEAMKTWTMQEGFPLVTVVRDWNNSGMTATLHQEMYVETGDTRDTMWDIPISYSSAGGSCDDWETTGPRVWLSKEKDQVIISELPADLPVVVNVQATGYYRVNYDETNWRMIGDTLAKNPEDIHPLNRAQIICDIIALSEAGYVNEEIKQHVLSYFDKEDHFTPKKAFEECSSSNSNEDMITLWNKI